MPHESKCSPREIQHYLGRISGPLLDRIDLHIEVPAVKFQEMTSERTGESSAQIRDRVIAARRRQQQRFAARPRIASNQMRYVVNQKNGASALGIKRVLGVSYRPS